MCRQLIPCLLINLNPTELTLKHFPQTQKLPKLSGQFQNVEKCESRKQTQILQTQIRLANIKEEEEIRQICTEYMDVFKLPGDKLTATTATSLGSMHTSK